MIFKNSKVYDWCKWIISVVIPASGGLYFAIASIWNLPYAGEINGTINAIVSFGCALLGISSIQYGKQKGTITFIAHEDDED